MFGRYQPVHTGSSNDERSFDRFTNVDLNTNPEAAIQYLDQRGAMEYIQARRRRDLWPARGSARPLRAGRGLRNGRRRAGIWRDWLDPEAHRRAAGLNYPLTSRWGAPTTCSFPIIRSTAARPMGSSNFWRFPEGSRGNGPGGAPGRSRRHRGTGPGQPFDRCAQSRGDAQDRPLPFRPARNGDGASCIAYSTRSGFRTSPSTPAPSSGRASRNTISGRGFVILPTAPGRLASAQRPSRGMDRLSRRDGPSGAFPHSFDRVHCQ